MSIPNGMARSGTLALLAATPALLLGCIVQSDKGVYAHDDPGPQPARVEIVNDTYDAIDVLVDNLPVSTVDPGVNATLDVGSAGTHRILLNAAGRPDYALADFDQSLAAGTTSISVYDEAPVVRVQNNLPPGDECVDVFIDTDTLELAIESATETVFDSTICPGETGFRLVPLGSHRVELYGALSHATYQDDIRDYLGRGHVMFTVP